MTTGSIFWYVISAVSGAFFVLAGLLMEQFSEQKLPKDINDFRRCKCIKLCGEWFVIGGVLIEFAVGIFSTMDAWENDPLNRPIRDIVAVVSIKVKGGDFNEIDTKLMMHGKMSWVSVLKMFGSDGKPINLGKDTLVSDDFSTMYLQPSINSDRLYLMRFTGVSIDSNSNEPLAKEINRIAKTGIEALFLPSNVEIIGGNVELIVNSNIRKTFTILPQKIDGDIAVGKFFVIFATNSSSENP